MKRVTDYEIIDHGVDHPQYFEGCGTAFTEFDKAFTGAGDTAQEALEEALEQVYAGEAYVPDSIEKAFDAAKKELSNESVMEALLEEREQEYVHTVESEIEGIEAFSVGESDKCPECPESGGDEGGFSRHACDLCNSRLGGNRYPAHGIDPRDGSILHYGVCEDCVQYVANGDVPDFSHEFENNELYYYVSIRVKVEE